MEKENIFEVKKLNLLIIAGIVWFIAGFNVVRLGLIAYKEIAPLQWWQVVLSTIIFFAFGAMFLKISQKHVLRIENYKQAFRPVWDFFDGKSYIIMAIMMGGGIWLRVSGLVPAMFIAIFYTGLGLALTLAGVLFLYQYFRKIRQ